MTMPGPSWAVTVNLTACVYIQTLYTNCTYAISCEFCKGVTIDLRCRTLGA